MIYQTRALDCGNKGWFWLTFAAVVSSKGVFGCRRSSSWKKKLVSARAAAAVASFIIGGVRPAARPPYGAHPCTFATWTQSSVRRRITAHQPLQISLSIYTCHRLRYYILDVIFFLLRLFCIIAWLFFGRLCVYCYFLRVEGRTHLSGCQPSGEKRVIIILSAPRLPPCT